MSRKVALFAVLVVLPAASPGGADSWTVMSPSPFSFGHGAAIAYPGFGDYLYALRGHNSPTFLRYSIVADSWSTLAPAPDCVHHGGAIAGTGGDDLYVLRAHSTAKFWKYSICRNEWTKLPNAPAALEHGAALVHAGGDFLYALRGKNSKTFFRYSIPGRAWTTLASLPAEADQGAALAYPGSGDFVYALRGKDSSDFYRYSISGNTWTSRASTPGKIHHIEGALASSGDPDLLYALKGNHSQAFWRYRISTNAWSSAASTPAEMEKGGALCGVPSTGRYLFATRGDNSKSFYRYEGPDSLAPSVRVSVATGQPDPSSTSPIRFTVQFSEPVTGFAADDVVLSGSADATTATVSGGPVTYAVEVGGMSDDGTVTISIPAGAATDGTHVSLASTSDDDTVLYSAIAPTVTVEQAPDQADPTATAPVQFIVEFSEPVAGFDANDVALSGTAGASQVEVAGGPTVFTVAVNGMASDGTVTVDIPAGAATDATGNPSLPSWSQDNTATYDTTPPSVTVGADPEQADPTSVLPITFIVEFDEPVAGFDAGDVAVSGTAGAVSVHVEGGGATYTVEVSGAASDGTVTVSIPAGVAADLAGNPNSTSTSGDDTVTYDSTPPTVTVTPGGDDTFTVEFSEPVTGFGEETGDVTVTGPAGTTTTTVTGGPSTYTVEVGGREEGESVTVVVPPGAAADPAGNLSLGSGTSADDESKDSGGNLLAGYCATSASGHSGGLVPLVILAVLLIRFSRSSPFRRPRESRRT